MRDPELELSFISTPLIAYEFAISMLYPILPRSCVSTEIGYLLKSLSFLFIVLPLPLVVSTSIIVESSMSRSLTIHKFTFVLVTIGKGLSSPTLYLTFEEASLIDRPVSHRKYAESMRYSTFHFTVITLVIFQFHLLNS